MATSRAIRGCLLVLMLSACTRAPNTATVKLAVSPPPADVKTVEVFVIDVDHQQAVASATTAADNTEFDLEVPAETLLDFRAIARTDKPGPPAVGAMPAYFGSSVRMIALGSQEVEVGLTLHRAGVLTIAKQIGQGVSIEGLSVSLEEEGATAGSPLELPIDALPESTVAAAGRYHARLIAGDEEARTLYGGRGLFIAPETESVALLDVETSTGSLDPKAPRTLSIALLDEQNTPLQPNDVVKTPSLGVTPVRVRIEAIDGEGIAVLVDRATLHVTLSAEPPAIAAGRTSADGNVLPAFLDGFSFKSSGRFRIMASAALTDGRTITGGLEGNVLAPGVEPSVARKMSLRIADPAALVQGTSLEIMLLDGGGLFAQSASGVLDLSKSDPWAYFPDGLGGTISPSARGHATRRISRPSGPRGNPVIVKATLTSTAIPDTLTATIALPIFAP